VKELKARDRNERIPTGKNLFQRGKLWRTPGEFHRHGWTLHSPSVSNNAEWWPEVQYLGKNGECWTKVKYLPVMNKGQIFTWQNLWWAMYKMIFCFFLKIGLGI